MFKDLGNGYIDIPDNAFGFDFRCHLPPVGYGLNSATGLLQETDIIYPISSNPIDHLWIGNVLPFDWKKRREAEKKIQKIDPTYVDESLEEIRKREWKRRLCGVWFYNYNPITKQSQLEYITGVNYFYITHWKFQGKQLDFRVEDQKVWYVSNYCMWDDKCLGLNWITKRKIGKTAMIFCWAYERVSRMNFHHAGMQSKTDEDAEDAFRKAVVHPWQKLPDFFRPRYDLMKGEEPTELRFFPTARRGSKIDEEDNILEESLESFFDYKDSKESSYDGPELHTYVAEEPGKTHKPVSILERQNVTRFCTEIDFILKGKHWYASTVEPDRGEGENDEFQELTTNSNPLERTENGMTGTGLYTYFLPAQRGIYTNQEYARYGYADVEANLNTIKSTISFYLSKNNTRKASSFRRKNPTTLKEAFSADGELSLYNPELLNNQLDNISWTTHLTEFGDLVWKDGNKVKRPVVMADGNLVYEPSEVEWVANPKGKFEKLAGWLPKQANNVFRSSFGYAPNNVNVFRIGCDPFRYDKTKDKRRSNCAAFGYQLPDNIFKDTYDDHFVIRYAFREESTRLANEDILKLAFWLGSKVLFERNVNHWKSDFIDWECGEFLMWLPGEVEPGIITAGNAVQTLCDYTEAYINKHIGKVYFKTLIRKETGWLGFKVEDTEKFDEPMGAGITLIAVRQRMYGNQLPTQKITDYFHPETWQS